jgi:16S rRNA (uracil1498-N3)-methyltransferase
VKHFILNTAPDTDGLYRITGAGYHYLVRVRRYTVGTAFPVLVPGGQVVTMRVKAIGPEDLLCVVCEQAPEHPTDLFPPLPPILLFQSLPKGAKMDMIIRQATESGVSQIVPFVSGYSVPKINHDKLERWNRIVTEARQQSGSRIGTTVREPVDVSTALAYWKEVAGAYPRAAGLLLHQEPLEPSGFHRCLTPPPGVIAVAIGPEGGFSPAEVIQFCTLGFVPVVLGSTVLRTETAALSALAAVRVVLLEQGSY